MAGRSLIPLGATLVMLVAPLLVLGAAGRAPLASRLALGVRSSVAIAVLGCALLPAMADLRGSLAERFFGVAWWTLLPAAFVVWSLWRARIFAVDEAGLHVQRGRDRLVIAWRDVEAVAGGRTLPRLLFRVRGQRGLLAVTVVPSAIAEVLAGLRREIPLQRLDPSLWDEATRAWVVSSLSSASSVSSHERPSLASSEPSDR